MPEHLGRRAASAYVSSLVCFFHLPIHFSDELLRAPKGNSEEAKSNRFAFPSWLALSKEPSLAQVISERQALSRHSEGRREELGNKNISAVRGLNLFTARVTE